MEAVDGDVEDVVVFVDEADDFLCASVGGYFFESGEAAYAVVDVGDVVARAEFEEFFECECLMGVAEVADGVAVVAFEDFVVGEDECFVVVVDVAVAEAALDEGGRVGELEKDSIFLIHIQ